ncbi:MAG: RNA polymerase sigma factor [Actinomycetota bacterium]|nr:sigma-70 family RNA polymerase sigma factor [Actinomycetota bacterium]
MTPPEAVAGAFERYRGRVVAVAQRILGDADEARDVAQEAFLALLERGPADEDGALPWLLTSARNRALNRVRDRGRETRKAQRAALGPEEREAFGDDSAADVVRRALDRLSGRDRTAIRLRYIEEADYRTIASAMKTTVPQARVVVHRAARRLRAATVTLLAAHHNASEECTQRLVVRVRSHPGCRPCGAVVDELHALASYGIVPLGIAPAWFARVAHVVHARLPRTGGRLTEALTALVVTGALALPVTQPVTATPKATSGAHETAGGTGETIMAEQLTPVTRRATNALQGHPGLHHVVSENDGSGDTFMQQGTHIVGTPLKLSDALDPQFDAGVDIRAFSLATIVDRTGRPAGLLAHFVLAAPAPRTSGFAIDWTLGNGCIGSAGIVHDGDTDIGGGGIRGDDGTGSVSCPQSSLVVEGNTLDVRITKLTGTIAEFVVAFPRDGNTQVPDAGVLLKNVHAYSQLGPSGQDTAPDGNGIDYQIER